MANRLCLGLFGGSFDPVHNAHIELAKKAINEFKLEKVLFIPSFKPPHKKNRTLLPAQKRLKMLSLALQPYHYFSISRYEINKRDTTFTYQTINHFKNLYPKKELYFIIGSDSLAELNTWKKIKSLVSSCKFIVGRRKGIPFVKPKYFIDNFFFLSKPIPSISSTQIRNLRHFRKSITGLLPKKVEKYILKNNLYTKPNEDGN